MKNGMGICRPTVHIFRFCGIVARYVTGFGVLVRYGYADMVSVLSENNPFFAVISGN